MIHIKFTGNLAVSWTTSTEERVLHQFWKQIYRRLVPDYDTPYAPDLELPFYILSKERMLLPAGLAWNLVEFLKETETPFNIIAAHTQTSFSFEQKPTLRDDQQAPFRQLVRTGQATLIAPPGFGKTIVALSVIAHLQQTALWIAPTPELAYQVIEKADQFLDFQAYNTVDEKEGVYLGNGFNVISIPFLERNRAFTLPLCSILIVDEVHRLESPLDHMSPPLIPRIINDIASLRKIGLTANEPSEFVKQLLGPVWTRITLSDLQQTGAVIRPRYVPVASPHSGSATRNTRDAISALTRDMARNEEIVQLVVDLSNSGHKVLVLSSQVQHCKHLVKLLTQKLGEAVQLFSGGGKAVAERIELLKRISLGDIRVLVGSDPLFEGIDLPVFDRVVLSLPSQDPAVFLQQVGRIMRPAINKRDAVVYDVVDHGSPHLRRLARDRRRFLTEALEWQTDPSIHQFDEL